MLDANWFLPFHTQDVDWNTSECTNDAKERSCEVCVQRQDHQEHADEQEKNRPNQCNLAKREIHFV